MNAFVQPNTTIEDIRKQFIGTDLWLKAPNGKASNLNEHQWLQVRTPAFKAWFGDWEHTPKLASKIVDENGEPLVVYHGTPSYFYEFTVFSIYGEGIFFAEHRYVSERYADRSGEPGVIKAVFLNIRNPKDIKTVAYTFAGFLGADARLKKMSVKNKQDYPEYENTPYRYKELVREKLQAKKHDGMVLEDHSWENHIDNSRQFVVFQPNQIKSAFFNNGLFTLSDDINL